MCIFLAVLALPSCDAQQVADMKAQLTQVQTQVDKYAPMLNQVTEQKAKVDALIASLPDGSAKDKAQEVSAELGKYIPVLQNIVDTSQKAISDLNANLKDAQTSIDVAEAAINTGAPFIPPPWGTIVAAAGGLVIGLIRAGQNKQAAKNIAATVDPIVQKAIAENPAVADQISAKQTNAAAKIVDQVQGSVASILPF